MTTLSAKEAAIELGTDARTFRKFMRSVLPKEDQPGQGNRYHIEEDEMTALKKQFSEWKPTKRASEDNGTAPSAKKKTKKKGAELEDAVDIDEEDEDLEDLLLEDDEEPDDDELLDLEDFDLDLEDDD